MEPTPESNFGRVFKQLRIRSGLSQNKVAAILEVDSSTIARLEAGTRKPPRAAGFYDRLKDLPGVLEYDLEMLLNTDQAPRWFADRRSEKLSSSKSLGTATDSASVGEVDVIFHLKSASSETAELDFLSKIIKYEISEILRDYIGRKVNRERLLDSQTN